MTIGRATASLRRLQDGVVGCRKCPRLVRWRERIASEKVPRFAHWTYWGKPLPSFGDPRARLLVVGLAPAAHGGNRTGRMFTGDRSGDWLYRTLHKFGFANRPASTTRTDGLRLKDCYITASVRCAPPQNKPLPREFQNCRPYLLNELRLLKNVRVVVALGKIAFDAAYNAFEDLGADQMNVRPVFRHGITASLNDNLTLIGSYHPSQRNTFTGTLTKPMFDGIFRKARALIR